MDSGTNHAVAIVGYDDAGGYWWVRNSWGTGWGDNGYFKLGYGECCVEQYVYYADAGSSDVGPLEYHSHTIDDDAFGDSNGNGDGVVNCGETIELDITLLNQGSDSGTGVSAYLATSDSHITLIDDYETYPDIPGGGTGENLADYDFQVAGDTPDGHTIHFDLDISASNGGPWSDSFDVPVICNHPPNAPSNPSPAGEASDVPISTDLSWTGGDPDGDSVTYDVYFGTSDPPTALVCDDTSSTTCDPVTLSYSTPYHWYVIANDGQDTTSGPVWDFTTGSQPNNPPQTPSSPTPADGATAVSTTTDLSWTGGDADGDSVTYDVYFAANDSAADSLVCDDTSSTTCDPGTLSYDTRYDWYVVANDGQDTTTGPVWDFTTESEPAASASVIYLPAVFRTGG
jgi:hypothetical protein